MWCYLQSNLPVRPPLQPVCNTKYLSFSQITILGNDSQISTSFPGSLRMGLGMLIHSHTSSNWPSKFHERCPLGKVVAYYRSQNFSVLYFITSGKWTPLVSWQLYLVQRVSTYRRFVGIKQFVIIISTYQLSVHDIIFRWCDKHTSFHQTNEAPECIDFILNYRQNRSQ